jgi:gas vesicle protein
MSEDRNGSFGCVGTAFLIGSAIGAAVALLFAPRSGEETREDIRKFYDRSRSRVGELQDDVTERIARLIDEIQEKTNELVASGKALAEERKRDLLEAIAIAKKALNEERDLLRRIRERGRSAVSPE